MAKIIFYQLVLLFFSLPNCCNAQKQGNIWYFPHGLGLDFNASPPTVLIDGEIDNPDGGTEGCSSISTKDGELLFYANGENVWNRKHQIMENGQGLMGNFSSTNGALIIPLPGENNKYYIFTTHAFQEQLLHGLRYSLIDMCGDNGYGEVIDTIKNISLLADAGEKLAFTKHSNGIDYWLVSHRHFSTAFHAFLITEQGISQEVISEIGSFHGRDGYQDAIGQMKISPDGSRVSLVMENRSPDVIDLFHFNTSTGKLSNYINLSDQSESGGIYGAAFSPDGSKLYTSGRAGIYQFSLDAGNGTVAEIIQSKFKLANQVTTGGLQLGPDGKIYVVRFLYAGVIQNPNLRDAACDFVDNAIYLAGRIVTFAFPSFLDSFDYPDKGALPLEVNLSDNQFSICSGKSVKLDATSIGENVHYQWHDGSNKATFETFASGEFSVEISDRFCAVKKTFLVTSPAFSDLGPDRTACEDDTVLLKAPTLGATYDWNTGAMGSSLTVHRSGIYWLETTKDNCTVRDSVEVTFVDGPKFSLGRDTTLCEGQDLTLIIQVKADYYRWQDGTSVPQYTIKAPGTYSASANLNGCEYEDEITVKYQEQPNLNLGVDTLLCIGTSLLLNVNGEFANFQWSTGSKESELNVRESGVYWVDATLGNCSSTDSVAVNFTDCILQMPNVFTPNRDDLNPTFVPFEMKGISSGTLIIYNRWGQKVFQTTDLNNGWDGEGESGQYFWEIRYIDVEDISHNLKGIVSVLK